MAKFSPCMTMTICDFPKLAISFLQVICESQCIAKILDFQLTVIQNTVFHNLACECPLHLKT